MNQKLEPGTIVVYVDSLRRRHNALVTAAHGDPEGRVTKYKHDDKGDVVWGDDGQLVIESTGEVGERWPCINLTYVSDDPRKEDSYGRQIERDSTSVPYLEDSTAAGFCFYFPGEEEMADKAMALALAEAAARRE